MRARLISAPVASPPACRMRSRWWPPSRVSDSPPRVAAVELGPERDEVPDGVGALAHERLDGVDVAEPDAGDEGVVDVLGRAVLRAT